MDGVTVTSIRHQPSAIYFNSPPQLLLVQRKPGAPDIAVNFPNQCADLPLDRLNDGWSNLGPNDDSSTKNVPIPFTFSLYGTPYSSLWVNNNGNISFDGPKASFSPAAFPNTNDVIIAPWWTDIDTTGAASGTVWYKAIGPNTFAAVWDRVGVYPAINWVPTHSRSSFQTETMKAWALVTMSAFAT